MLPLKDVRILDLSRLLPGPYASLVLADLGASVDKVEDTGAGDYLRAMPPLVGDQSGMFLSLNRNKRSICLDLKKPSGREAFLALVRRSDVVIDPFRPGVLDRLDLSHEKLRKENPRLIVCAITGYGQDGPMARVAGHDVNYLARAGVLGFQGPKDDVPAILGIQLADVSGALWCVIGILAALKERDRTGEGSVVDVAMVEASMGFASLGFATMFAGVSPQRGDDPLSGGLASYGIYATKDERAIALGALEPKFWLSFCSAVGLDADVMGVMPGAHQTALKEKVAAIFRTRTQAEWIDFARAHDVCLEPVLTPEEASRDPHLEARGMFVDVKSPWGDLRQMRTPITPRDLDHAAPPRQGEHTRIILREAGYDDIAITKLEAEGAAR